MHYSVTFMPYREQMTVRNAIQARQAKPDPVLAQFARQDAGATRLQPRVILVHPAQLFLLLDSRNAILVLLVNMRGMLEAL
jgi:hypothetical protein